MYKKIAHFVYQIKPKRKADGLVTSATFAQFAKRIFVLARDLKSSRKQSGVLLYLSEEQSVSQPKIIVEAQTGSENSWKITGCRRKLLCPAKRLLWLMPLTSNVNMEYWCFAQISSRRISFGKRLTMKGLNPITELEERLKVRDSRQQRL